MNRFTNQHQTPAVFARQQLDQMIFGHRHAAHSVIKGPPGEDGSLVCVTECPLDACAIPSVSAHRSVAGAGYVAGLLGSNRSYSFFTTA
jgi:hypothetical protein